MKIRTLIIAALAAFAAVSCGPKVKDVTDITGILGPDAPKSVEIGFSGSTDKWTFDVTDGKFTAQVPANTMTVARLKVGNMIGSFISDGTPLTLSFNEDKTLNVVSKYPKVSVAEKYVAFQKAMKDLQDTYSPKVDAASDADAQEKIYEAYQTEVKNLCLATVAENNDNLLALNAIGNLRYLVDANQLDSILATVGPAVAESDQIQALSSSLKAKKATAEGEKFTDFQIGDVKFSDYVGKGKFILVDFWASWCGPCKAEVPNIKAVYEKYAGKDFDVLGVAVWDKPADTEKAIKDLGLPWNQIIDAQQVPTDIYGIEGIPHIILFGPDGTIVKRNLRGAEIEATVAKYVQPVR